MNLVPQRFGWWTFDPCIKLCGSYHKLVMDAIHTGLSNERPIRDLLGRIAIIGSAPLGYVAAGFLAGIGVIFNTVLRIDLGHAERCDILNTAAYAGRKDIIRGILDLNRHENIDLVTPIKNAGTYGERAIVELLLERIDVNAPLDANSGIGMLLGIELAKRNGWQEVSDLIENKYLTWRNFAK
ncbi:MAG: hypothetical protein K2X08_07760 [Chlamydiales bacterium]|nr:hypothetical protein [Chlamydiales bacterium]MBY0529660.1 hypothetical protein [Rhabdochlamydiaceae bacterium]